MNLYSDIKSTILTIIKDLQENGLLPTSLKLDAVDVMPPRDLTHGDMATNAAMVLAGPSGMKPRDIADLLAPHIQTIAHVQSVEIAGPGFINIRFHPLFWQHILPVILNEGIGYGNVNIGRGEKINVEYVSANPTGPLHVGHGRGAVYGDALAILLLKAGYNVTKEYYINDGGAQVDVLAESVYLRYCEALGEDIGVIREGLYPGDYLVPVGEALAQTYGDRWRYMDKSEWLPHIRSFAIDAMMILIKEDLERLGIVHDVFTSERQLTESGGIETALEQLDQAGLIYEGVLEPPKGKSLPEDWEPRPQLLFRSTAFGDDMDRAIRKSNGQWTYFAPDIAYHFDKIKRGHNKLVDVLGADHGGYVSRIQSAVRALSSDEASLTVKLCQLVKFMRGGEPVKMSKRKGTFMTVREVVEEVGNGVFRFIMLTRKNDIPLDFDFQKVTEQSKENPVFYVQYAYARTQSLIRLAQQESNLSSLLSEDPSEDTLAMLSSPAELDLIRLLASWPRMVESAAIAYEPHRIAFYLQDVAATFHSLWNMGNSDITLRFIQKDAIDLTAARLALVRVTAIVIASGLQVLGIQPMQEMRS